MEQIINSELKLNIPDSFSIISEEEMAGIRIGQGGEGICFRSEELHIVASMGWKKEGLLGKLLNGDDLIKNMDSSYRKAMKPYGYRRTDDIGRAVDGVRANGFRYEYDVQGVAMTGESLTFKKDDEIYYLHVYYRTELSESSRAVWSEILDSAKWQQ